MLLLSRRALGSLQAQAVQALENLRSWGPECQQAIASSGAITALLDVLKGMEDDLPDEQHISPLQVSASLQLHKLTGRLAWSCIMVNLVP